MCTTAQFHWSKIVKDQKTYPYNAIIYSIVLYKVIVDKPMYSNAPGTLQDSSTRIV